MSRNHDIAARNREALKRATLRGYVLVDGRWRRKSWLRANRIELYRPTRAGDPDWVRA